MCICQRYTVPFEHTYNIHDRCIELVCKQVIVFFFQFTVDFHLINRGKNCSKVESICEAMDPRTREKLLSYFYPLIVVLGFVCTITSAIVWNHWKYVLDTCVERNCGCILNGVSTITYFTGGHIAYCHYVTFALLLSAAAGVVFGSYHLWRTCMSKNSIRASRHSVRHRFVAFVNLISVNHTHYSICER